MRAPVSRPLVLAVLAVTGVALAGCSFRGGVSVGAPATTSSRPPTSAASSPTTTNPTPAPSTPTPTATTPVPTTPIPTTPVPTTPTPSAPPTTVGVCTSAQLVAALAPADAPAGRGAALLTLTNTGRSACHLKGFGGISLSRSDGAPVLSRQVRTDAAPAGLTLEPGDVARSSLSWSTVANTAVGEPATGGCEAVPTSLLVIPPDQIADQAVPWSAGPVCDQGSITQTPYTSG
ncbi:DUF4232 domain-containing protein [Kineococcus endophyticus]|uniref:DUF4232 domain-containing protein n=1 Tax=Kineococcus endophyticus TaxID=1181883 RepID=A0ABV3PBP3_9ACTN